MAMMHPRFNHLGRSRRKPKKPTKTFIAATEAHQNFLRKMGVEPGQKKRTRVKFTQPQNQAYERPSPVLPSQCLVSERVEDAELNQILAEELGQ